MPQRPPLQVAGFVNISTWQPQKSIWRRRWERELQHAARNARRMSWSVVAFRAEVALVNQAERVRALTEAGLMHPSPEAVSAPLFTASGFFLPVDKVQVKYEMLRAHAVDGVSATASAAAHGYSRAAFYLVSAAFERAGMTGLLDERPGRRGPVKITPEILAFLVQAPAGESGADLAGQVAARFGVELHRRTVERIRR